MLKISIDRYYDALVRELLASGSLSATREPREPEPDVCSECNSNKIPLFTSLACPRACDREYRTATLFCPVCGHQALHAVVCNAGLCAFRCVRRHCVNTPVYEREVLESEART